jgi:hypothetical protein
MNEIAQLMRSANTSKIICDLVRGMAQDEIPLIAYDAVKKLVLQEWGEKPKDILMSGVKTERDSVYIPSNVNVDDLLVKMAAHNGPGLIQCNMVYKS